MAQQDGIANTVHKFSEKLENFRESVDRKVSDLISDYSSSRRNLQLGFADEDLHDCPDHILLKKLRKNLSSKSFTTDFGVLEVQFIIRDDREQTLPTTADRSDSPTTVVRTRADSPNSAISHYYSPADGADADSPQVEEGLFVTQTPDSRPPTVERSQPPEEDIEPRQTPRRARLDNSDEASSSNVEGWKNPDEASSSHAESGNEYYEDMEYEEDSQSIDQGPPSSHSGRLTFPSQIISKGEVEHFRGFAFEWPYESGWICVCRCTICPTRRFKDNFWTRPSSCESHWKQTKAHRERGESHVTMYDILTQGPKYCAIF
ncbi:hypothetical protein F4779DRAFT_634086 [Xylariaceae sp. FL0662B]|nr:hypothetical protein F4779DRAFT_634086 [Xylariaceae sp. FL0662B]